MPRAVGQIDTAKTEAILDAASEVLAERGLSAPMEAIARRAGVSRQTLYNRFPSKLEIGQALASRRSDAISAPLRDGGDPETVLTSLASLLLDKICSDDGKASMRGVALMSPHAPEVARAIYAAGPGESLRRLSAWLAEQDRAGRLSVPDPDAAAEMFSGMALGHGHLRAMLDVPQIEPERRAARAREAARVFLAAYSPKDEVS